MTRPDDAPAATEKLRDALQHLARAEVLLDEAGAELGEPFAFPLSLHAEDVRAVRRRTRNAALTAGMAES